MEMDIRQIKRIFPYTRIKMFNFGIFYLKFETVNFNKIGLFVIF